LAVVLSFYGGNSAFAAPKVDPAEKYFQEGNAHATKSEFQKAIDAYKKAIKFDAKSASIHYNLANVLIATNQVDEAIKEYNIAIELNPLIPDFHRNLGFAYAVKRDGKKAKEKYEALKILSPKHAEELMLWIKTENEQLQPAKTQKK
jgi:tetratricopeptide (TPR) repeat protein